LLLLWPVTVRVAAGGAVRYRRSKRSARFFNAVLLLNAGIARCFQPAWWWRIPVAAFARTRRNRFVSLQLAITSVAMLLSVLVRPR
jgi:hypothetical protein